MDYFIKLLREEYQRLKKGEENIIKLEARRRRGLDIWISAQDLSDLTMDIIDAEIGLQTAIIDYKENHEVKDKTIAEVAHPILSGYEQHANVRIRNPDYDKVVETLNKKKEEISCVAHHTTNLFNPRKRELWNDIKEGDTVALYFHNLNSGKHVLSEVVTYIGQTIREKTPKYIIDHYKVNIDRGIDVRVAASIVQANKHYSRKVFIGKEGVTNDEPTTDDEPKEGDGKSIMHTLTLVLPKGTELYFKYEKPETEQDKGILRKIRGVIGEIVSSAEVRYLTKDIDEIMKKTH